MSQNTPVTRCRSCGQLLRVPQGQVRLVLTCPKCCHRWDWVAEEHLVRFRCAVTSEVFYMSFLRLPSEPKLRIADTYRSGPDSGRGALPGGVSRRFDDDSQTALTAPIDVAHFDFTGWACAHCGFTGGSGLPPFVLCHCGTLTCGGRTSIVGGQSTFRCHDRCGRSFVSVPLESMPTLARPQQAADEGGVAGLPAVLSNGIVRGDDYERQS